MSFQKWYIGCPEFHCKKKRKILPYRKSLLEKTVEPLQAAKNVSMAYVYFNKTVSLAALCHAATLQN